MARWKYGKRFGGSPSLLTRIGRWPIAALAFGYVYLSALYLTLPDVRPLATAAPEPLPSSSCGRAKPGATPSHRAAQRWVDYDDISPNLKRAVLTAEDSAFFVTTASTTRS